MLVALLFNFLISGPLLATNAILKRADIDIKDPMKLRDPFKRKNRKLSTSGQSRGRILTNNKFSNYPNLGGRDIESIRIVGVLLGENRRAIARIVEDSGSYLPETYFIKEGMPLGLNGAIVKAIVPGGIVLAEKVRNVYEEDEYIETVIPITTPPKKQ